MLGAIQGRQTMQRDHATVTGSRFCDLAMFLVLLWLLVAKAPRLAVYYRAPAEPAPATAVVTPENGVEAGR